MKARTLRLNVCIYLCMFIFIGCNYTQNRNNVNEDKHLAQKFCNEFYEHLISDDMEAASLLFRDVEQADRIVQNTIDSAIRKYGKVQEVKMKFAKSTVTEISGISKGNYTVVYDVARTKGNTQEKFQLSSSQDTLEIVSYDVASVLSIRR